MQLKQITLTKLGTGADQTMVFNPRGVNPTNGVASLATAAKVPALENRLSIAVSQPSRNRKTYKVTVKASNPVECSAESQCSPVIQATGYCDITFSFSTVSTAAERALLRTEIAAFLQSDLVADAIDNLNPAY